MHDWKEKADGIIKLYQWNLHSKRGQTSQLNEEVPLSIKKSKRGQPLYVQRTKGWVQMCPLLGGSTAHVYIKLMRTFGDFIPRAIFMHTSMYVRSELNYDGCDFVCSAFA